MKPNPSHQTSHVEGNLTKSVSTRADAYLKADRSIRNLGEIRQESRKAYHRALALGDQKAARKYFDRFRKAGQTIRIIRSEMAARAAAPILDWEVA